MACWLPVVPRLVKTPVSTTAWPVKMPGPPRSSPAVLVTDENAPLIFPALRKL